MCLSWVAWARTKHACALLLAAQNLVRPPGAPTVTIHQAPCKHSVAAWLHCSLLMTHTHTTTTTMCMQDLRTLAAALLPVLAVCLLAAVLLLASSAARKKTKRE